MDQVGMEYKGAAIELARKLHPEPSICNNLQIDTFLGL